MRKWIDLMEATDAPLALISAAVQKFGQESLYGGNCGQFALGLARHLAKQGQQFDIAIICADTFHDDADVEPMDIVAADVPVYHVALAAKPKFYDADGEVTGDHIIEWIIDEYGDDAPALFIYSLNQPGLGQLIRSETAWSIPAETFEEYFSTQSQ